MLKESTLRNQLDFKVVYNKGKSKVSRFMVIIYKKNGLKYSRLAYVSSKKVGNSVRRNRSRRLMREAYRLLGSRQVRSFTMIKLLKNIIKRILIIIIRGYQKFISPLFPSTCRFYPTCSTYFIQALEKYGPFKGTYLGIKRILRCHPGNPGGYDPLR